MKNKKTAAVVVILVVMIIGAVLAWTFMKPGAVTGEKNISVTVVHADGAEKLFNIRTDSENLREPLEKEGIASGTEGPYGLYILTCDGETADEAKQQWWCVTKAGGAVMSGVDELMISDGDRYELTLKTGW